MLRSFAPFWLFAPVAAVAFSLGCQQDSGEPIAQGRKYEVAEDDPAELPSDSGDSASNAPGDVPADGGSGESGGLVPAPGNGAAPEAQAPNAPTGVSPVTEPSPKQPDPGPGKGGGDSRPTGGATTADASKGTPEKTTAKASGPAAPQSIPFQSPPPGQGITMASYEPPKDGSPQDLLDHLRNLNRAAIKGRTQQEQMADFAQLMQNRILTSELLMNSPRATLDERMLAVNAKIESLDYLHRMGNPNILSHAMTFAAALKRHPVEELARRGRIIYLSLAAGELADPENSDAKWIEEEILAILEEEPANAEICEALQKSIGRLVRFGEVDAAKRCGQALIAAYGDNEDKAIQQMVGVFRDEMGLIDLEFAQKLEAAMTGKDGGLPALTEAAETAAKLSTRGQATMQVLAQSGQFMEFSGNYDAAAKIYGALQAGYEDWPDKDARESVTITVDAAMKRLALVGKPLVLSGETVDGGTMDWSKYKGKIVLIDFWATWCEPCLREIPNIAANYKKYRSKGFEVVGYNLDSDPRAVEAFFKSQKLPWPSVLGKDPAKRGFGTDEFAASLGIDGIPFVVLLNREGNVEAIHVRGDELGKQLERLLGPVEDAPASEDAKAPTSKADAP